MPKNENQPVNNHLKDILETALSEVTKPQTPEPIGLSVVVKGNNNVVAWGGVVHMGRTPECRAPS